MFLLLLYRRSHIYLKEVGNPDFTSSNCHAKLDRGLNQTTFADR
ncbi:MAG: hypothetical protein ACBR12_16195 [Microcoleus sp.]